MSRAVVAHEKCPDCGHDGCYTVYDNGGTYCFSCMRTTSAAEDATGTRSMFTIPEAELPPGGVRLPENLTDTFPNPVLRWLLIRGIDKHIRTKYQILYIKNSVVETVHHKKLKIKNAVFLPVLGTDERIEFYQLRFLDNNSSWKYLTIGQTLPAVFGNRHSHTLVLVEDMLSAIRIAESGSDVCAMALLGLGFKREHILKVCSKFKLVYLWLDDDDAGNKASEQLKRRLQLYTTVVKVKSTLEAKECYNHEIRGRLSLASLTG